MMTFHYVYILECNDDTLYTGYTTDVKRRVEEHNQGNGAKYTRGRTPVNLVYTERFTSKSDALRREHSIKQLSHREKRDLFEDEEESEG